jgi:RHS repeat-associated protein
VHSAYVFTSLELRGAAFDDINGDFDRTATTESAYLIAHGSRIGRIVYGPASLPSLSGGEQHVFLEGADVLGSSSIVIDKSTSELVEASSYLAYGGADSDYRPERWAAFREDHRFTGKEEDIEVGIDYFGKRYYAPLLGRWISADPLAVHSFGADANVYAYVHGRVYFAVDPFGLAEGHPSEPGLEQSPIWPGTWLTAPVDRTVHAGVAYQHAGGGMPGATAAVKELAPGMTAAYQREGGGWSGVYAAVNEINPAYQAMTNAYDAKVAYGQGRYFDAFVSTAGAVVSAVKTVSLASMISKTVTSSVGGGGGGTPPGAPPPPPPPPPPAEGGRPAPAPARPNYVGRYGDGTLVTKGDRPPHVAGPDPKAGGSPHTVLRRDASGRLYGAKEYGNGGNHPTRDMSFTQPTYPNGKPRPDHLPPPTTHSYEPNPSGGTPRRGGESTLAPLPQHE